MEPYEMKPYENSPSQHNFRRDDYGRNRNNGGGAIRERGGRRERYSDNRPPYNKRPPNRNTKVKNEYQDDSGSGSGCSYSTSGCTGYLAFIRRCHDIGGVKAGVLQPPQDGQC
ncbi:hypothetical protein G6F53_006828 [Rhizopus delemar]|nr:hypothetical protein G6F53_006828 [Rhizopus delemar]